METFSISLTTLKRWLKMRREGKDLSPRFSTGRKRRILATLEEKNALWRQLEENDDATLERHCEMWEERRGVKVAVSTMNRAIREKLGWTSKKKTLAATERDEEARNTFREPSSRPACQCATTFRRRTSAPTCSSPARHTVCPYKGVASYRSVNIGGEILGDLAWYYPEPLLEAVKVRGHLCFYGEKVETEVDD